MRGLRCVLLDYRSCNPDSNMQAPEVARNEQEGGNKMSDLKPCPFCGGEATHDTDGSAIWVICKKCGARCTSSFFSGKKGVRIVDERWNRRAPSEQPEIIRCKDCKYIEEHHYEEDGEPPCIKYTCTYKAGLTKEYQVHEWDYCSRAERRTDGVDS